MSTQVITADKITAIKAAALAAANAAKATADKGTKLPVAQWVKRDIYEKDGTALLIAQLTAGAVVCSVGKVTVDKAGNQYASYKLGMKQGSLESKVETFVTNTKNSAERRKLAREAAKAAKDAKVTELPKSAALNALANLAKKAA